MGTCARGDPASSGASQRGIRGQKQAVRRHPSPPPSLVAQPRGAEQDGAREQMQWNQDATEVEWEHAARGGRNGGPRYPWGDALVIDGRYMANTWQGEFPHRNTVADGCLYTSPVGVFGKTPARLTDMGGNVWQWCEDWFRPYAERASAYVPDAQGEKVIRGGSFLCDPKVCHGFHVSAHGDSTPETGLVRVGFRCARDAVRRHRRAELAAAPRVDFPVRARQPPRGRTTVKSAVSEPEPWCSAGTGARFGTRPGGWPISPLRAR
jgi:formylglycine-generating enzyme required for sulfatase activity